MICPKCGETVPESTRTCPSCGAYIDKKVSMELEKELIEKETKLVPIKERPIVKYVLLWFLTFGLFGAYWFYCIDRDLTRIDGRKSKLGPVLLVSLALNPILFLLVKFVDLPFQVLAFLGIFELLFYHAFIVMHYVWFVGAAHKTSKAARKINEGEFGLLFLFCIALYFGLNFLVYIKIQKVLNAYADAAERQRKDK